MRASPADEPRSEADGLRLPAPVRSSTTPWKKLGVAARLEDHGRCQTVGRRLRWSTDRAAPTSGSRSRRRRLRIVESRVARWVGASSGVRLVEPRQHRALDAVVGHHPASNAPSSLAAGLPNQAEIHKSDHYPASITAACTGGRSCSGFMPAPRRLRASRFRRQPAAAPTPCRPDLLLKARTGYCSRPALTARAHPRRSPFRAWHRDFALLGYLHVADGGAPANGGSAARRALRLHRRCCFGRGLRGLPLPSCRRDRRRLLRRRTLRLLTMRWPSGELTQPHRGTSRRGRRSSYYRWRSVAASGERGILSDGLRLHSLPPATALAVMVAANFRLRHTDERNPARKPL